MANEPAIVLHLCPSASVGLRLCSQEPVLDDGEVLFLDLCRKAAHSVRCQRFMDLRTTLQAAAHVSSVETAASFSDKDLARPEFLGSFVCLLRLLHFGFAGPPRLYARSSTELSFDEAWLLSLLRAVRYDDADSVWFLLTRRIAGANAHLIRTQCLVLLTHIQICLNSVDANCN